ncbi:MAG: type II toxin-antitoxin system RelB/DinJ family antitoxin [Candidatus Granulicatella sp. P6S_S16_bin.50.1]|nr:type II toxin-antitoxin system RelB/DinJ family antitoxin [Candidatus Granulicatella sp. P6S_S16_bin.50.1]
MAKSEIHTLQIDSSLKEQAESLFSSLDMTLEEAVTLFLEASILHGGIPFPLEQPRYNEQTELALQEARDILSGKLQQSSTSVIELIED